MSNVESGEDAKHLLEACRVLEENSLYTAQAHFEMGARAEVARNMLLIVPAVFSAAAGALVAMGYSPMLGVAGALAGMLSAVASVLGVDKPPMQHRQAANLFTALRHEARSLRETFWCEMPRAALVAEVKRLEERYAVLAQTSEPTDDKAFNAARNKIRTKLFEMDFRASQQVPAAEAPQRTTEKE